MKLLAFQIEKTHRRERPQQLVAQIRGKVISLKVRKQVKDLRNIAIRRIQLAGQIAPHRIAIALKYTPNKAIQRVGFDQVNLVKIKEGHREMPTDNTGVQTRAMAQHTDSEPQETQNQNVNPTVELYKSKDESIKDFV